MRDRLEIVGVVALSIGTLGACGSSPAAPSQPACTPVAGSMSRMVREGDLFRFGFRVPGGANADVMFVWAGSAASGLSSSAVSFRLYDGARRLAAIDDYQDTVGIFKSPESAFGIPGSRYWFSAPAAVADFHSIVDGTIDGRIEFAVTRGSLSIVDLEQSTIMLLNPDAQDGIGSPVVSARELCR